MILICYPSWTTSTFGQAQSKVKQEHLESADLRQGMIYLYPGGDLDHSQNLMGSKLNQDPSFFMEIQAVVFV